MPKVTAIYWRRTTPVANLSEVQAGRIIARIDEKLEQLPKVIEQKPTNASW